MSPVFRNLIFLLLSLALLYFARTNMQFWMASPQVVAFEFLKTEAAADALLSQAEWQPTEPASISLSYRLRQNTYWDFLFIVSYVLSLLFLARTLLGASHRYLKTITGILLAAGLSDVLENLLIFQVLDGHRGFFPAAVAGFAAVKFGLLILGLGWILTGLVKRKA
jgi:hypothetical protein